MPDEIRRVLLAAAEEMMVSGYKDWNYGENGDVADCVRNALFAVAGCIRSVVPEEDA